MGKQAVNKFQKGGWLDSFEEGGEIDDPIAFLDGFRPKTRDEVEIPLTRNATFLKNLDKNKQGYDSKKITFQDNRKIRATTGKSLPVTQRKNSKVSLDGLHKIVAYAKKYNVDPYEAIGRTLVESNGNFEYNNPFHIVGGNKKYESGTEEGIKLITEKTKYAKKLGYKDPLYFIQAFNGLGKLTPNTEKNMNNGKRNAGFYGVPFPSSGVLDMKKNPLYGIEVTDITNNIVRKNQDIKNLVDTTKAANYTTQYGPLINKIYKENVPLFKQGGTIQNNKSSNWLDSYEDGSEVTSNPLMNIPESQKFPKQAERTVVYPQGYIENRVNPNASRTPLNFMGQPFATGAIEESISPLDLIGGVRGGVGLIKGSMKYKQAMKPNYIQIGDELFNMGPHPRVVRRATKQMHKGARNLVLPNAFEDGSWVADSSIPTPTSPNYYPDYTNPTLTNYQMGTPKSNLPIRGLRDATPEIPAYGYGGMINKYAAGSTVWTKQNTPTWVAGTRTPTATQNFKNTNSINTSRYRIGEDVIPTGMDYKTPSAGTKDYSRVMTSYDWNNQRRLHAPDTTIMREGGDIKKNVPGLRYQQLNPGVSEPSGIYTGPTTQRGITFEDGGDVPPYITSDPNDPRLKAYNDSLDLFKSYGIAMNKLKKELKADGKSLKHVDIIPFKNNSYYEDYYKDDKILPIGLSRDIQDTDFTDYVWHTPIYKQPVKPVIYKPKPDTKPVTPLHPVYPKINPMPMRGLTSTIEDVQPQYIDVPKLPVPNMYMDSRGEWSSTPQVPPGYTPEQLLKMGYRGSKKEGGWINSYEDGSFVEGDDPKKTGLLKTQSNTSTTPTYEVNPNISDEAKKHFSNPEADGQMWYDGIPSDTKLYRHTTGWGNRKVSRINNIPSEYRYLNYGQDEEVKYEDCPECFDKLKKGDYFHKAPVLPTSESKYKFMDMRGVWSDTPPVPSMSNNMTPAELEKRGYRVPKKAKGGWIDSYEDGGEIDGNNPKKTVKTAPPYVISEDEKGNTVWRNPDIGSGSLRHLKNIRDKNEYKFPKFNAVDYKNPYASFHLNVVPNTVTPERFSHVLAGSIHAGSKLNPYGEIGGGINLNNSSSENIFGFNTEVGLEPTITVGKNKDFIVSPKVSGGYYLNKSFKGDQAGLNKSSSSSFYNTQNVEFEYDRHRRNGEGYGVDNPFISIGRTEDQTGVKYPIGIGYKTRYKDSGGRQKTSVGVYYDPFSNQWGGSLRHTFDNARESKQKHKGKPVSSFKEGGWINSYDDGGFTSEEEQIGPTVATAQQQAVQRAAGTTPYLNPAMVQATIARANQPTVNTLGQVVSTPASREKERREKVIGKNPAKYSVEDYKRGIQEPGLENDVLNDPIAMAAALTAGGVGLGAYGLSQVPRMFARNVASEATAGLSDFFKKPSKFTSEIDWSKWNKEILEDPQLIKEYDAIEQAAKANGTWMKYSDGTPFTGTPEQFVQMNFKDVIDFAGGNLKLSEQMYKQNLHRGSHFHVDDFANRDRNDYATFLTDSKKNAESYAGSDGLPKTYHHPDINVHPSYDPNIKRLPLNHEDGIYHLGIPQNLPKVVGEGNGNNWRFLNYDSKIANNINTNILKNDVEFRTSMFNSDMKKSIGFPKNYHPLSNQRYLTTDNYAAYVKNSNNSEGIAQIKNVKDQMGYSTNIPANTVYAIDANRVPIKSLRYNTGRMSKANSNIYKAVVPAAIGAGALQQNKNNNSNTWLDQYN